MMAEKLSRLLVFFISQTTLFVGLWRWWSHAKERPVPTLILVLVYEIGVFILSFSKMVIKDVEEKAAHHLANHIWTGLVNFSPRFSRRYKRQVIAQHGVFNVRGLGLINTYTLRLEQVFVDLRIVPSKNPQKLNVNPVSELEMTGNRPIWDFLHFNKDENRQATGLAIIGPPGCGKTTLLQHIALTLAANRQRRYGLEQHVPILLFLRDHIPTITEGNALSLEKLVQAYFSDEHLFPTLKPPVNWFEKKLKKDRCIVLLDGLDEVADLKQREIVSQWVDTQMVGYPNSLFVLTSRPQGYRSAPLQHAHVLEVQPFSNQQVRRFVENWYLTNEIISSGNQDTEDVRSRATDGAQGLLARLHGSPSLNALTVNPLLLTMIAMVHRYHGALPGSRVELYDEICEVLLGRWRQTRGVRETLSLNTAQKLVVLRPLAAHMMSHRLRDISFKDAMTVVRPSLKRVGLTGSKAENFLEYLQNISGLLLEREAGFWSFAHLTFQEFLTATYWLEEKVRKPEWSEVVGDSWWHETLRLYAAQSDATPLVRKCLDVDSLQSLTLAVECLDEARELDEDVRHDVFERLIDGLESDDPARQRLAAEVQLSRRLTSLQRIDDTREIDLDYLSCAEYQLFLDDKEGAGKHRQPDHWSTLRFAPGHALSPIRGVRAEDAVAFCQWLTKQRGGQFKYRLPRREEALQNAAKPSKITGLVATWTLGFELVGLTPQYEEELRQYIIILLKAGLPHPTSIASIRIPDLISLRGTSPLGIYVNELSGVTDRNFDRTRNVETARKNARELVKDLLKSIYRDKERLVALYNARARELSRNRTEQSRSALDDPTLQALERALFLSNMTVAIDPIIKAVDIDNGVLAKKLLRDLHEEIDVESSPIIALMNNILIAVTESSNETVIHNRRNYVAQLIEYVYQEQLKLGYKLSQSDMSVYWWLKVIIAREDEGFPAWEGIRIVQESPVEGGG